MKISSQFFQIINSTLFQLTVKGNLKEPKKITNSVVNLMDAKPWSFLGVLEPKSCYEVPLYQRQYVWDQNNQWEPLWEDISRKLREGFMKEDGAPPHFLGAIVVDQEPTRMGELKRHLIIDGQQRLITFQVFLSALRDFSKSKNYDELAVELDKFIFNEGMMANPDQERYKVWPSERDIHIFHDVIETRSLEGLIKKYPLVRRKYQRQPDPRPLIVDAYLYFFDKISEFFNEPVEDSSGNTISLADKLTVAFHVLGKALQVVVIELSQADDAQVIFETLNARGEPLLPSDLLRNFIFLRARKDGLKTSQVYESYWKDFDEEFWRNEITQGRTTRPRSDLFMQHFLASQTTRDISVKHLYAEYKNWALKEHPFPTVQKELEAIVSYRKSFKRLIDPQLEDPISHLARTLKLFDMTTAYPPLMVLLSDNLNNKDLNEVGKILESYLMRRAILNLSNKNLNRIFLGLASNLKVNGISLSNVNDYLSTKTGESGMWPTDEQFLKGWTTAQIYNTMSQGLIIHMFLHLNNAMSTAKNEKVETTYLTVEHLMPYQWEEYWPLPDGSKGMTYNELYDAEEGDERAEATKFRNSMVQTIGNLTIIPGSLNSAIQNKPWNVKKEELQKYSLLAINQRLWGLDEWNEITIEHRSEEIFELARHIWGPPLK